MQKHFKPIYQFYVPVIERQLCALRVLFENPALRLLWLECGRKCLLIHTISIHCMLEVKSENLLALSSFSIHVQVSNPYIYTKREKNAITKYHMKIYYPNYK